MNRLFFELEDSDNQHGDKTIADLRRQLASTTKLAAQEVEEKVAEIEAMKNQSMVTVAMQKLQVQAMQSIVHRVQATDCGYPVQAVFLSNVQALTLCGLAKLCQVLALVEGG